jgi:hypothetical protein
MFTFSGQTLPPLIISASSLPNPGDNTLAMVDISNFTTTKIVDKRPGRSGVEYKCEFGPLWLAARLAGTAQVGHVHVQARETSRGIEEEKARVFTNICMLSRQLSVSIPPLHQPIVYLAA